MATEQQQQEEEEEFTFPTFTAATFSSAVDSPPLWSLSPAVSPDHSPHSKNQEEKEKDQEEYCFPLIDQKNDSKRRKSFSCIERGHISISKEDQEDQEDEEERKKMDMLWEDFNFNEELSLKRSTSSNSSDHIHHKYYNMGLSCLQVPGRGIRLSNKLNGNNNKLLSKQQQQNGNSGFVMFIKVLKKLFLMHRHRHINLPRNHCSVLTKRSVNLS